MGSKPIDMPLLAAELAPTTEPVPEPLPEPTQDGWGLAKTATGLVAILLLGGVAMGLLPIPGLGSAQGPAPAPAAIEQPATPSIARLSLIQPVAAAEFERAIGGMLLSDDDKAKVRGEVMSGMTRIGWITVSDSDAEDGDWVTVSSAGFSQSVRLFHKPTTVAVAYAAGAPVVVTGAIDGDGKGITVAVHVGASIFPLTSMQIGTSIQVPTP